MIKNFRLTFILLLLGKTLLAQKVEFGFQFQQNSNRVASDATLSDFSERNHFFDILGTKGDTIGVYMRSYQMDNNFEIPMYLRYQMKNRFFFELNYSNSVNKLRISGKTNYSDSYFTSQYGTYEDFDSTATAGGYSVDSADYESYINGYKRAEIRDISATEEFKLASFGFNFGMKLLPHKSIHPFFTVGFTYKTKYRKRQFQSLDYLHPEVRNYAKVKEGIDRFKTNSFFTNFSAGLEFYRFRIEAFYQGGILDVLTPGSSNDIVLRKNAPDLRTNFYKVYNVGFKLSATLFSKYIGKDVHYDELSDESVAVSNIRKKRLNWSLGFRFKRRVLQTLSTFYEKPGNQLNVLQRDTAYLGLGGNLYLTERLQAITLSDITNANWSGQYEVFGDYHFSKRFFITGTMSFSALSFDVSALEFQAIVLYDSLGSASWLETEQTPIMRSAVYRKQIGFIGTSTVLNYELISRQDFSLRMNMGFGSKFIVSAFYAKDLPSGVNDLGIYERFDAKYTTANPAVNLYASQGKLDIQPSTDPNKVLAQLPSTPMDATWEPPKPHRFSFPYFRVGTEVAVDRFSIGMSYEHSLGYMDGFMLNNYSSLYFSIGYRIISR